MDLQEIFDTYTGEEEESVSFEELSDCISVPTEQDKSYVDS